MLEGICKCIEVSLGRAYSVEQVPIAFVKIETQGIRWVSSQRDTTPYIH